MDKDACVLRQTSQCSPYRCRRTRWRSWNITWSSSTWLPSPTRPLSHTAGTRRVDCWTSRSLTGRCWHSTESVATRTRGRLSVLPAMTRATPRWQSTSMFSVCTSRFSRRPSCVSVALVTFANREQDTAIYVSAGYLGKFWMCFGQIFRTSGYRQWSNYSIIYEGP